MTSPRWEPEGFASLEAWRAYRETRRLLRIPTPQPQPAWVDDPIPECDLCVDSGWVSLPDPMFAGALVDQRCPACQDHSVRATRTCFENNWGQKVGP